MTPRRFRPQRAAGLPPGQRLLATMPRFSDDPRRPPPRLPETATLVVTVRDHQRLQLDEHEIAAKRVARPSDFHCVTGWSVSDVAWEGVPLADLVSDLDVPDHARAVAHDGAVACFRTDDLLDDRTIVATHLGGQPLDGRHGAPIRLVTPHLYGYKNVKHLARIEFVDERPESQLGPKEHLRARVDHEERHARLPNWLLRPAYRAVIPATAWIAARSLARASDPAARRIETGDDRRPSVSRRSRTPAP